jgi:hypothetical protein
MVLRARSCTGDADGLDACQRRGHNADGSSVPCAGSDGRYGYWLGRGSCVTGGAWHEVLRGQASLGKAGYGPGSAPFAMLRNHLIEAALSW